jgi:2,4-dienoyl-CoA reductase-like NADH-dependent reductase (Old Yellow Enzyme family)
MGDFESKMAPTPQVLETFLEPLAAAGVDIFHCSTRRFFEPEFPESQLNLAGWTRKITGKPVITVGSVGLDQDFVAALMGNQSVGMSERTIHDLTARLDNSEFDLVAVGRALLADKAWVVKVTEGRFDDIIPFDKDLLKTLD